MIADAIFVKETKRSILDTSLNLLRSSTPWVRKLRTYLEISAFSIDNTWRGASEIVYRLDFDLSNKVSFKDIFPRTPPIGSNCCICIAWKPSVNTIVRYKIWKDVGEILWVPLYSGQAVSRSFYFEIWNVKPVVESGGTIVTEDEGLETEEGLGVQTEEGESLESEESTNPIQTESGDTLVTEESGDTTETTTILSEAIRLYTSLLVIPTDFCSGADSSIGEPLPCVDPIFNLTGFNPFLGDYYSLETPCSRILHHGTVGIVENKLQSTDGTWHLVTVDTSMTGTPILNIHQDNTTPGVKGYFEIIMVTNLNRVLRVDLEFVNGTHVIRNQTLISNPLEAFNFIAIPWDGDLTVTYGLTEVRLPDGSYVNYLTQAPLV